jgi:hypothetical protein
VVGVVVDDTEGRAPSPTREPVLSRGPLKCKALAQRGDGWPLSAVVGSLQGNLGGLTGTGAGSSTSCRCEGLTVVGFLWLRVAANLSTFRLGECWTGYNTHFIQQIGFAKALSQHTDTRDNAFEAHGSVSCRLARRWQLNHDYSQYAAFCNSSRLFGCSSFVLKILVDAARRLEPYGQNARQCGT